MTRTSDDGSVAGTCGTANPVSDNPVADSTVAGSSISDRPATSATWLVRHKLLAAWLVVAVVALGALVVAVTANPPPATEAARAAELKENTLCPVCDGQNVLESNAPVAAAIRRQIDELVEQDRSDEEIRTFLARQYGDDVNALPPGTGWGSLVWVLPVAGLLAAAAGLVLLFRNWSPDRSPDRLQHGDAASPTRRRGTRFNRRYNKPSNNKPGFTRRSRGAITLVLIAVGAITIGVVVARTAGLAIPGQTITGEIDRSARSLLFDAQNLYAQGEDEQARELINEIFATTDDLPEAFILSARLYEREGEVLSALVELDRVLNADPDQVDALTLRGWLLVRIPDEELIAEGIGSLDAALAQTPDQFDPWVFRGYVARVIEGDLPLAVELYEQALLRNPPPAMTEQLSGLISEMRAEIKAQAAQ